jgi:hypothetical protein
LIATERSWCSTRRSRICWSISGSKTLIEPRDFCLGAEQRRAGIGEQRGRVRAVVRKYRDAGGDAGANRLAVDLEFVRQRLGELFGQRLPASGCLPSMIRPNSSPPSRATTPPRAESCMRRAPRSAACRPSHGRTRR